MRKIGYAQERLTNIKAKIQKTNNFNYSPSTETRQNSIFFLIKCNVN